MYCGKCGAKNESGAVFCGFCGAPLGAEETGTAAAGAVEAAAKPAGGQNAAKHKKIGIIAVAAVAIALVCAVFSLFGGRSDMETAEQFVDAVFDMDAKAIVNLLPKDVIKEMEKHGYDTEAMAQELSGLAEELKSSFLPMGFLSESIRLDCEAVSASDVDASRLADLQESYRTEVGMNITAAREVTVSLHIQMEEFGIDTEKTLQVPVIKSGGTWYIDAASF